MGHQFLLWKNKNPMPFRVVGFLYLRKKLVEVAGIEPASLSSVRQASTCLVGLLYKFIPHAPSDRIILELAFLDLIPKR